MSTNRVAIGPIRAILCAQKAKLLGYMLGRTRALGRPKGSQKIAPENVPNKLEKSSNILLYLFLRIAVLFLCENCPEGVLNFYMPGNFRTRVHFE